MIPQPIINIAEICARKNIRHAVLSPGSRSAPLAISFARHPEIKTWIFPDERSAGYIAAGMAAYFRETVAVICTSGTAALNLVPAVVEAYYQQIPLLILTADRPPEWIDQYDNQTIRQSELYGKHVKASYSLPASYSHPDEEWHCYRILSEAISLTMSGRPGPAHINVPLREPLYPAPGQHIAYSKNIRIVEMAAPSLDFDSSFLSGEWDKFSKKLIIAGHYPFSLVQSLEKLSRNGIPIVGDITSNQQESPHIIRRHDIFLSSGASFIEDLQPDLLITFGGPALSKALKLFLRKLKPLEHWHIQKGLVAPDTYQAAVKGIDADPAVFLDKISNFPGNPQYGGLWRSAEEKASKLYHDYMYKAGFGEFRAVDLALRKLPQGWLLHLASSMSVRYANYVGLPPSRNIRVFSNRGVSGIDGCNSFAVGTALVSGRPVALITGDLAFFYDRNAFWHNYPLNNLRIILLNNHGGGIFRMLEGPSRQPELEEYFETRQRLSAANTAADFGLEYIKPGNERELNDAFEVFYSESDKGKLLEVDTNSIQSKAEFDIFKTLIKKHYESEISLDAS